MIMPELPEVASQDPNVASLARKRRIELRNMQRGSEVSDEASTESKKARVDAEVLVDPVTSKPKPSITGIKKQSRYDPGVPMTRDELTTWRKEARRVRNRESAAESRKRNRDRISELETEVDALKSKYAAALNRILELEAAAAVNDSFTPTVLRQDLTQMPTPRGSVPASPRVTSNTVSPPLSPTSSFSLTGEKHHEETVNQKYQHIMEMISRPIA